MAFDNTGASLARPRPCFTNQAAPGGGSRMTLPRLAAIVALALAAGCASAPKRPPQGTPDPDRFLYERGTAELNDKDWFTAREVLPAAGRQLSAEPVPGRRQARHR